jgi:predicted nucleic acid-binding protein
MAYLIDTDVMIDVSRGNVAAANYVDSLSDSWIAIVTAQELIVGARDKRDVAAIDGLIGSYPDARQRPHRKTGIRPSQDLRDVARSPNL